MALKRRTYDSTPEPRTADLGGWFARDVLVCPHSSQVRTTMRRSAGLALTWEAGIETTRRSKLAKAASMFRDSPRLPRTAPAAKAGQSPTPTAGYRHTEQTMLACYAGSNSRRACIPSKD